MTQDRSEAACSSVPLDPLVGPGGVMRALINLNDETGKDLFSVECEGDIGNWLDSFETLEEAEYFINARLMLHIHATDFRDTRMTPNV